MRHKDQADIIGGSALVVIGLMAAAHSYLTLRMGSPARMGPGTFPFAIGVLLAGLGGAVLLPAFFRSGTMDRPDWRSLAAVSLSLLSFSLVISWFGLLPAIVVSAFTASRADRKLSMSSVAMIVLALSAAAFLIFRLSLGLSIPFLKWPGSS
jgi:hypothetical protein